MFVKFYDKAVKDENGRLESQYRILRPSENLRNACRQVIGYTEILRFQTAFFQTAFFQTAFFQTAFSFSAASSSTKTAAASIIRAAVSTIARSWFSAPAVPRY